MDNQNAHGASRRDFLFFQGDNDTSLLRAASTTKLQNARKASYMK